MAQLVKGQFQRFRNFVFLGDVLRLALTAFGGPQVHYTQFQKLLVKKKKYLSEEELKEINSLCTMLPGPTSTQTITAIGFKRGGATLAFFTLGIWVLPACLFMGAFALLLSNMAIDHPRLEYLRFLQPMASGFLIFAAIKFIQIFIHKPYHWALLVATSLVGILLSSPWLIPLMLLIGGLTSSYIKNKETLKRPEPIKQIRWDNLLVFIGIFIGMAIIGVLTQNRFFLLFENNYRYGSMVFGGGHVLIPLMFNQFVEYKQYMMASDFLAGVGLLQAMPGPVFSIASFAGAMSTKEFGILGQLLGWFVSSVAIFLPGILLIFFVYPIWNQLKNYTPVKNAIEGINAASAGLVITSAYLLFLPVEVNEENMLILLATLFLLLTTKVPSPFIVIGCIAMGFII